MQLRPAATTSPVTPRMIIEGMLFVGAADGRPMTSGEMAAHMRNVSAEEVDALVVELRKSYRQDGSAYDIESGAGGHRLQLREVHAPLRERFRGQVRAARLTPAALEVLSVVAYRPGVGGEEINRLRGTQSYAILAQLVRRQLVRVERSTGDAAGAALFSHRAVQSTVWRASPADLPAERGVWMIRETDHLKWVELPQVLTGRKSLNSWPV